MNRQSTSPRRATGKLRSDGATAEQNAPSLHPHLRLVLDLPKQNAIMALSCDSSIPAIVAARGDDRGAFEPGEQAAMNAWLPAAAMLLIAAAAALVAGWAPVGCSVVAVFLFAGPHNWMEARYMLSRMPPRWGRLRPYFLTGIAGVLALTALFALLPAAAHHFGWGADAWNMAMALWNSLLVLWVLRLVQLRARQQPRRDWPWALPAGLALLGLAWLAPQAWDLGLVYLHPLLALVFLDREMARRRSEWQRGYRLALAALPLLLGVLWWQLHDAPPLGGDDALTCRIANHAGAGVLRQVSSHFLVAMHTFLEMVHYAAWIVAMPLVATRALPWQAANIPLAARGAWWRRGVLMVLACGGVAVLVLWAGFLVDYPVTRDVYFTVAMLHVLAEIPFLLRLM